MVDRQKFSDAKFRRISLVFQSVPTGSHRIQTGHKHDLVSVLFFLLDNRRRAAAHTRRKRIEVPRRKEENNRPIRLRSSHFRKSIIHGRMFFVISLVSINSFSLSSKRFVLKVHSEFQVFTFIKNYCEEKYVFL